MEALFDHGHGRPGFVIRHYPCHSGPFVYLSKLNMKFHQNIGKKKINRTQNTLQKKPKWEPLKKFYPRIVGVLGTVAEI